MTTKAVWTRPEASERKRFNRREFLNFAWLASLGILTVNLGGVTYLFAMPRFKEDEFGGQFSLGRAREVLPAPGGDPINIARGKFWLVLTGEEQLVALYKVCTHRGCLYNWQSQENIFICPCHGSQFELDGTYIKGPAPRGLDRFVVKLIGSSGELASTNLNGEPLPMPDVDVIVETDQRILGAPHGGAV